MRTPSPLAAPVWRVVATRNPPVSLFEDVAPADAQDALVDLEMAFHRALFLETTGEGPMFLEESLVTARAEGAFADVRGLRDTLPDLYSPDLRDYPKAQAWAAAQRAAGRDLIAYGSVRRPAGSCVAVFRPKVIQQCRLTKRFRFWWDGQRVQQVP